VPARLAPTPYLGPRGFRHERLPDLLHGEHGRRLDVVPLLLKEHVLGFLLAALLALGHALVLADRHLAKVGGEARGVKTGRDGETRGVAFF
jgi:hypothetical protein